MIRTPLSLALILLAGANFPAAASEPTHLGLIPLRLSTAEPSYLGVSLPLCDPPEPGRGSQDARLPVSNDGSMVNAWGATIPLLVLDTLAIDPVVQVRVVPLGFDLAGDRPWTDSCGSFTYTLRLNPSADQPQSVLLFETDADGLPTSFNGTLYVAAVLNKLDTQSGELSQQVLNLALNVHGAWLDEPSAPLLDDQLSSLLPFTELDARGLPSDRYTCVNEAHPFGHYCLQISPDLLSDLGSR